MASIIKSDNFTKTALLRNGITVSRTPITITYSGNGDEIRTEGTPENITVIFHRRQPNFTQNEEGLVETSSGYIMTGPTQTINRNDLITYSGETFRVTSVIIRGPSGSTAFYKYCEIEQIS